MCQAKVNNLYVSIWTLKKNVVWLDVSVDKTLFMSGSKTFTYFPSNPYSFWYRDQATLLGSIFRKIRPVNKVHSNVWKFVVFANLVDRDD